MVSAQCPLFLLTVVCVPTVHNPSKWSAAYLEYLHRLIIKDVSQHEDVELGNSTTFQQAHHLGVPCPLQQYLDILALPRALSGTLYTTATFTLRQNAARVVESLLQTCLAHLSLIQS